MEPLDYWRLCDEFTVTQAALLIIGEDPGPIESYIDTWDPDKQPTGYRAARHALMAAVRAGTITANVRYNVQPAFGGTLAEEDIDLVFEDHDEFRSEPRVVAREVMRVKDGYASTGKFWLLSADPAWDRTTIYRAGITVWLEQRGIRNSFFTPNEPMAAAPNYLNAADHRYAPKLAAAVKAWIATGDPSVVDGKSAKKAITKWLNEHAAEFGLCDDEGIPNKTGIEQCAAVANWQPEGGAPKTPSR